MIEIDPNEIEVRNIDWGDFPILMQYFFESPPEYMKSIGLRPPEPGDAEKFESFWKTRFDALENGGAPIPVFTIFYRGERVGFHTSTHHIPNESITMHAHLVRADLRGKGIGLVSYVLAIEKFFQEFKLARVIFKTPVQNLAPMRIKEKLGIKPIAEEIIDWPALVEPLQTKVFHVTPDQVPKLKRAARIET